MTTPESSNPAALVEKELIGPLTQILEKRIANEGTDIDVVTHEVFEAVEGTRKRVATLGLCTVTDPKNGQRSVQGFYHVEGAGEYEHFPTNQLTIGVEELKGNSAFEVKKINLESFLSTHPV